MKPFIYLKGASGTSYSYYLIKQATTDALTADGGNYAFLRPAANGNWYVDYVGECESFRNRLPSHERWTEAQRKGCVWMVGHTNPAGEAARLAEEKDLIQSYQPPMNTQHRGLAGLLSGL